MSFREENVVFYETDVIPFKKCEVEEYICSVVHAYIRIFGCSLKEVEFVRKCKVVQACLLISLTIFLLL